MRLIDADELITFLEDVTITDGITFETGFKQVIADIKNQPTAFDVEKVIEELENLKMSYFLILANTGDADKDCAYLNITNAIDRAIEIVKRGGRDEID